MTRFIKIIVSTAILVLTNNVYSKPLGLIKHSVGNVFVFNNGELVEGQPGVVLEDFSTVTTEVGGQVTIVDYFDREYHLSGSGSLAFLKNLIELKRGYLWIQSNAKTDEVVLKTTNAQITFTHGEGIISYDQENDKTQLLTISGYFDLSNIERAFSSERVQSGNFSFVDGKYDNGIPRRPTPVGKNSYLKVVSLFRNVEPKRKDLILGGEIVTIKTSMPVEKTGRTIASIETEVKESQQSNKNIAEDLMKKELVKINSKFKVKKLKTHPVKVNIFWPDKMNLSYKTKNIDRVPASIPTINSYKKSAPITTPTSFEKDLIQEYKNQQKHDKELNNLINELDSYKQDYNTNY